ncbi:MAG: hypothetical protein R3D84_17035 [Paracoccaceae bacterium]
MSRLGRAWSERRAALLALGAALILVVFFAVRGVVSALYWADPAHATHPVEGWMTPRYVVRAYGLEPEAVADALGIAPQSAARQRLSDIAAAQGVPVTSLTEALEALIAASHTAAP